MPIDVHIDVIDTQGVGTDIKPAIVEKDNKTAERLSGPFTLSLPNGDTLTTAPFNNVQTESATPTDLAQQIKQKIEEQKMIAGFEGDVLLAYVNYKNILEKPENANLNQDEINLRFPFARQIIDQFFITMQGQSEYANSQSILASFSSYLHFNWPYANAYTAPEYREALLGNTDNLEMLNQLFNDAYMGTLEDAHEKGAVLCGNYGLLYASFAREVMGLDATTITMPLFGQALEHVLVVYAEEGSFFYVDPTAGLPPVPVEVQMVRNQGLNYAATYIFPKDSSSISLPEIQKDIDLGFLLTG